MELLVDRTSERNTFSKVVTLIVLIVLVFLGVSIFYQAARVLYQQGVSLLLSNIEGSAIFWITCIAILAVALPLNYVMTIFAISTESTSKFLTRTLKIVSRFLSALPMALLFSFALQWTTLLTGINEVADIFIFSLVLAICLLPTTYLLSSELFESSDNTIFASRTIGMNQGYYIRKIFSKEFVRPLTTITMLGALRAIGEWLVLYNILENHRGGSLALLAPAELIQTLVNVLTVADYAPIILIVFVLAVVGQTIIGIGAGVLR